MAESVHLRVFSLNLNQAVMARLSEFLAPAERERAARFHFERDRNHWIAARAGLRLLLAEVLGLAPSEIAIETEPGGKPFVPGSPVHFNLSHSGGRAVVVFSKLGPAGVDLEPLDRRHKLTECVDQFCHPAERQELAGTSKQTEQRLLRIWCAKEAYLKALGVGFATPPAGLRLEQNGAGTLSVCSEAGRDSQFRIHFPVVWPDFIVAVALPADLACPAVQTFELAHNALGRGG